MTTTYNVGDILRIYGTAWRIDSFFTSSDGSPAAVLVDTVKPRYGTADRTAFTLAVLDADATKLRPRPIVGNVTARS